VRKNKENKISLFNVLVGLFLTAGIIIFFVNNIIVVNNLVVGINDTRNEINKTVTINNNLQTEIERLSTFENIKPVAVDKLKLSYSNNRPKKITVEKSELENLKQ
jgi:hypothetical protein